MTVLSPHECIVWLVGQRCYYGVKYGASMTWDSLPFVYKNSWYHSCSFDCTFLRGILCGDAVTGFAACSSFVVLIEANESFPGCTIVWILSKACFKHHRDLWSACVSFEATSSKQRNSLLFCIEVSSYSSRNMAMIVFPTANASVFVEQGFPSKISGASKPSVPLTHFALLIGRACPKSMSLTTPCLHRTLSGFKSQSNNLAWLCKRSTVSTSEFEVALGNSPCTTKASWNS